MATELVSLDYLWIGLLFFTYIVSERQKKYISRIIGYSLLLVVSLSGYFVGETTLTIIAFFVCLFILVNEIVTTIQEWQVWKKKKEERQGKYNYAR